MKRMIVTLLSLVCVGYGPPPKAVKCKTDPVYPYQLQGNAGCFITRDRKILMVREASNGTLGLPGGTKDKNELAACTAHREVMEETGIDVVVGRLLTDFGGKFFLFHCTPTKPPPQGKIPVPSAWRHEIREVLFVDPGKTAEKEWRFPKQAVFYQRWIDHFSP